MATSKLTTTQRLLLKGHPGKTLQELLLETFNRTGSITATAEALEITVPTCRRWFAEFGIETRAVAEVTRGGR